MKCIDTPLHDLKVLKPIVHRDARGYFLEAMNADKLKACGIQADFTQENQAFSVRGVLRGLHFQKPPSAQGKLVRAIYGSILDVAVDVRRGSPTYGKHYKALLTAENQLQIWIPPGFAHGALTLSESSIMAYFCTTAYSRENSVSIRYDDPLLGIDWGVDRFVLTDVDRNAPCLHEIDSGFQYLI